MNPAQAARIAFIAHTACGQMRADGKTPYFVHPKRVAELTTLFSRECEFSVPDAEVFDTFCGVTIRRNPYKDREVAAYLHDVLEDTQLRRGDLIDLGISFPQLDIVERLTKPDNGPAPASYYQGIAANDDALVVKCADRCANLDDAFTELVGPGSEMTPRRWAKYVDKTYTDVLPMYKTTPGLRYQLEWRLQRIELALPDALARRQAYVDAQRAKADPPQTVYGGIGPSMTPTYNRKGA